MALLVVALGPFAPDGRPLVAGRVPGATAIKACAAAGPFWPTETLALYRNSAWLACKEQQRVVRLSLSNRRVVGSVRLGGSVIAVATGAGSIWALDTGSMLYRIDPATSKVTKRVDVGAGAPYNIWIGGGSVWVVDDQAGEVVRVSLATNKVLARISVGDGPADIVFGPTSAWVINHRDRRLVRIELATNAATTVATIPGDAPERMVMLAGSLWITGRGTDLLRIDPRTGALEARIEIGAGGIDVVATRDALWVPSRSVAVDPSGLPTMETLRRVAVSTQVVTSVATAVGRVDVHGLQAQDGSIWLADNREGIVYRLKA